MSNFLEIEKALIAGYEAVGTLVATAYPGKELTDADKPDDLWCHLHNIRADTDVFTLGGDGMDNNIGFMQIDVNYPKNKGSGAALAKADELATAFSAGTVLTYNTQNVRVIKTSLGPGRDIGGYYRISLTVNYYAFTQRNP